MNVVQLVMAVVILGLLIAVSVLLPQVTSANQMAAEAQELSAVTKQLLRNAGAVCTARNNDFRGVINCVQPVLSQNNFVVNANDFRPFNEVRNETGVIIATNRGAQAYQGEDFLLYKNGEFVDRGCHISAEILRDFTCRFSLDDPCERGDVYELRYEQESGEELRLVTRTC